MAGVRVGCVFNEELKSMAWLKSEVPVFGKSALYFSSFKNTQFFNSKAMMIKIMIPVKRLIETSQISAFAMGS